jgi:hypothetical protein
MHPAADFSYNGAIENRNYGKAGYCNPMSHRTVVLCIARVFERQHGLSELQPASDIEDVVNEILASQERMPDYLRFPLRALTSLFNYSGIVSAGGRFQSVSPSRQAAMIESWRGSRFNFCRNFVRFYESLYLLIVMQEDALCA